MARPMAPRLAARDRFLVLNYRRRMSGRFHQTVLEVLSYNAAMESVIVSSLGATAAWHRSIRSAPGFRIQTGRLDYVPRQRFLPPDDARERALAFRHAHPLEARLVPRVLSWIGAASDDRSASAADLLASLPMVGFRPDGGSPGETDPR